MRNHLMFGSSALAVALAAALPALAQEATPPETAQTLSDVVVVARQRVETPVEEIKRAATGVTDSITAEEIERTADTTLPETLERVVGVSSDSFYGTSDAGYVSLRGFDSRYNSMDIDGNPIWFSSQNNRGAQIGMFPAAIVKETSVYKTVTPDQDGNSIGGHISMRTLRAFDGGSRPYLTIGGRLGAYDQESIVNEGPSGRLYAAGKRVFGPEGQYGAVFGLNVQRYRGADVYGGVDGYNQIDGQDLVNANIYHDSVYDRDTVNTALFGKLEMRRGADLYGFVSANLFDEAKDLYLLRTATYVYQTNGRTTNFEDGRADFTGGQGQTREYDYDIDRRAYVLNAGLDLRTSARGVVRLRGSYTDFTNDILTRYPDAFILSGVAGSYDLNDDAPTVTVSDPARYNDPANWRYRNTSNSYERYQALKDKVIALRADYEHNAHADAEGLGLTAGLAWTRLDRDFDQDQDNYRLRTGSNLYLSEVTDPGLTMAGNQAVQMNWDRFWSHIHANGVLTVDQAATTDYALVEDVAAAHAALRYARGPLRLLAGARYEQTEFEVDTSDIVSGAVTPSRRSRRYGNWLPNLQATWDFTPQLRLRGAFTQTIGRADFSNFAPGRTTSINANGVPVISGTNPDLDPRESINYDLSLEYYLRDGIVALAVFHKDLDNEIFSERRETFDSDGMLALIETIPLNTGAARVRGLEFTASKRRLDLLPAPFDALGVTFNATLLDGQWDVVFTDGSTRSVGGLRNQPKWLGNLIVRYDAGLFDVNLALNARGRTFTGTFGTTEAGDRWIEGYETLNLTVGLDLARGVRLTAEARNLTDSYIRQTTGVTDAVYNSVGAGRSYFLGFRYRY